MDNSGVALWAALVKYDLVTLPDLQ
ncbi:unnamed protein product, partial [Rotaria sp. Silwood2]